MLLLTLTVSEQSTFSSPPCHFSPPHTHRDRQNHNHTQTDTASLCINVLTSPPPVSRKKTGEEETRRDGEMAFGRVEGVLLLARGLESGEVVERQLGRRHVSLKRDGEQTRI